MKNITLTLILTLLFAHISISQSCLSGYNRFNTQAEVDNFLINNPNCTSIEGELVIWEMVAGAITNLDAFQNITEVQGFLQIRGNVLLENINGLSNLTNVGGHIYLQRNDLLTDLDGFRALETVGENLFIGQHDLLSSLKGLEKLSSLGGHLNIRNNNALTNLKGLKSLTSIAGYLNIQENPNLRSLIGLENVDPNTIESNTAGFQDLTLLGNVNLNYCNNNMVCEFLDKPGVDYLFQGNSFGCNSDQFILAGCISQTECLPDGGIFDTQEKIDLFSYQNYGCTTVGGDIYVEEDNSNTITDLNGFGQIEVINGRLDININFALENICGLSNLREIEKSLYINFAPELTSLEPLANLTKVGENLTVSQASTIKNLNGLEGIDIVHKTLRINSNTSLESLDGLQNVSSVGSNFNIDGNKRLKDLQGLESLNWVGIEMEISRNDSLVSCAGMESLDSIGFEFYVYFNKFLPNFNGLEKLSFIGNRLVIRENLVMQNLEGLKPFAHNTNMALIIHDNVDLMVCNSEAICELIVEDGYREIRDNAPGCNSVDDVEISCIVSTNNLDNEKLQLYPNPANQSITVKAGRSSITLISIFNFMGERIRDIKNVSNTTEFTIDISDFPSGTFVLQTVNADGKIFKSKFVKI